MNNTVHYTACPICEDDRLRLYTEAKDHLTSNETFKILECANCQFRFTQDIPDQAQIGQYYASENYISHSNTNKGLVNKLYHFARNYMLNAKVKLLDKFNNSSDKTLLDIGSGTGHFLSAAESKGWKVKGIEADEGARTFSIKEFGLEVHNTDKFNDLSANQFQIISMWHVLEHVHTLHEYIQKIHELLADDGTLIIAVPNSNSLDAKHYKSHWAGWDVPRHLYHFTPKSMERLLNKHQFQIKEKKMMPFDPFYISLLSEQYQGASLAFIKGMLLGNISFYKGLSNTDKASSVIYIAKKNA